MRKSTLMAAGLMCLTLASTGRTQSVADYPDRPIRIVVPFAAGGATDVIARLVGQRAGADLGQPVVVENKAGANGNIGAAAVARATPDGYTILMATSAHAINATLYPKLDYSLTRDFAALSNLASVPLVLVVNPNVPARTLPEFVAHARARGDAINVGSGGVGTAAHLAAEQFNTVNGTRMQHIAYKGGALAQTDLMGGQIQAMFANLPEVLPQIQAGKLRPLAIAARSRRASLPDVPTFAEAGMPQVDARSWFGLFAPAGTPAPVVARLSAALAKAVADGAVRSRLEELGADPIGDTHEAFQKFVAQDVPRWGELVKRSGARID
jgi:tripartite-type tricarboxylate transporter receptor subunit TctC